MAPERRVGHTWKLKAPHSLVPQRLVCERRVREPPFFSLTCVAGKRGTAEKEPGAGGTPSEDRYDRHRRKQEVPPFEKLEPEKLLDFFFFTFLLNPNLIINQQL